MQGAMSDPQLVGALVLPSSVYCAQEAMGLTFAGRVWTTDVWFALPGLPPNADSAPLDTPLVLTDPSGLTKGREVEVGSFAHGLQDSGKREDLACYIRMLAFVAPTTELSTSEFHDKTTLWWRGVLSWLELWTRQRLDLDAGFPSQMSMQCLDRRASPHASAAFGPTIYFPFSRGITAVTGAMLIEASERVALGDLPAVQWRLLRRAERLVVRDGHQAILVAASAAEVCLAEAIRELLLGMDLDGQERIILQANGLIGLIDLLEALESAPGKSRRRRLMDRVAKPRNYAAHAGITPTPETLNMALNEIHELLDHYTPAVPTPTKGDSPGPSPPTR